jgi:hypothetical protein
MHRIEGAGAAWSADGKSSFKTSPPYTVMTPDFANAIQEEIMYAIEQAGLPILSQNNDTRQQLYQAMRSNIQSYDYFVNSQQAFANLFERTGANAYRIKSDYSSVFFKKVTGGYSVAGILSGGDTWGDISTNACEHLEFQNGAYISFAAMRGNLTVNTDGCYLHNVDIRGNGGASVTVESFLLNAYRVTFDNCKCSSRLSSVAMTGFQGSGTAAHNYTSKYVNCSAYTLDTSGAVALYGFKDCANISGCSAYDLDTATGNCYGFFQCKTLSACASFDLQCGAANCYAFSICYGLSACCTTNLVSTNTVYAFSACRSLSGCYVYDITTAAIIGFDACYCLSGCYIRDVTCTGDTRGFNGCYGLTGCYMVSISVSAGSLFGFHSCLSATACYITTITGSVDVSGFYACTCISGCYVTDITATAGDAVGFETCICISSSYAANIVGPDDWGFLTCECGAALYSAEVSPSNDYMDTTSTGVINKISTHVTWT